VAVDRWSRDQSSVAIDGSSVVTPNPANGGHLKTGQ